ncbi:lytic polysaccharide monooxygenase [Kribbella sp. NPDC050241]|uniref:lytic polysaccharide monooxygenase n=1 Tax=Kribbella sp. NPDC050241 TaxID=3364115 RepID=UPI0037A3AF41
MTKQGWDQNVPLTRRARPGPVPDGADERRPPANDVSHPGTLPNRSGRHMILAVWTINDTANAFYQCSDVNF